MSSWSENWKATHSTYVKANKGVKSVLEHRNVEKGEIYCVAMAAGGFEVRHYEGDVLKTSPSFPSGVKAILAYRELRDKLVPNREAVKKVVAKPKPKVAKAKK